MTGYALCLFSITIAIIRLISDFQYYGQWSMEDFVGVHSYFLKATFTVWNPRSWQNGTNRLWNEPWEDPSPMSITVGVISGVMHLYAWMQEHMFIDIVLLVSFSMQQHMTRLVRVIQDDNGYLDAKWEEYEKLKNISNKINAALQYTLPLTHQQSSLGFILPSWWITKKSIRPCPKSWLQSWKGNPDLLCHVFNCVQGRINLFKSSCNEFITYDKLLGSTNTLRFPLG